MLEAEKTVGESLAYSESQIFREPHYHFPRSQIFQERYGSDCFSFSFCISLSCFIHYHQAVEVGKTHLFSKSLLNLAEIADVPSSFQRTDLQLTLSCIGSDENRRGSPPKRSSATGRTTKKEENKKSPVGKKLNSSNQEEIIALFRRIQSSISEEESTNAEEIHSNTSAESILQVLRRSKKQVKGKATNKEGGKVLTKRRGVPKKEQGIQGSPPVTDFKLTRPPSKFVKISPIPSLTAPRGKSLERSSEALPITDGTETDLLKLEEIRLPELKKLAKSRGIRGYSKLKKSELVNLLRS